jgi:hypothetical protein
MDKSKFLIYLLNAVPENSIVDIDHNSAEMDELLSGIYSSNYHIQLTPSNMDKLIKILVGHPVENWIIHLNITYDNKLLVNTYDIFCANRISKSLFLSDEFKAEFVDDDQVILLDSL